MIEIALALLCAPVMFGPGILGLAVMICWLVSDHLLGGEDE